MHFILLDWHEVYRTALYWNTLSFNVLYFNAPLPFLQSMVLDLSSLFLQSLGPSSMHSLDFTSLPISPLITALLPVLRAFVIRGLIYPGHSNTNNIFYCMRMDCIAIYCSCFRCIVKFKSFPKQWCICNAIVAMAMAGSEWLACGWPAGSFKLKVSSTT